MHDHHRVSFEGKALGRLSAQLASRGLKILKAKGLDNLNLPMVRKDMCKSCACRPGTVPNGCIQTQLDFLKAVVEGGRFLCHAPNNGKICQGMIQARAGHVARPLPEGLQKIVKGREYSPADEPHA